MTKLLRFLMIIGLIGIGWAIYNDAAILIEPSSEKPYVIQQNIESTGYSDGKKIFHVHLDHVKQNQYQFIQYAKSIVNGKIFNQNETHVISNITGHGIRINTNLNRISVTNNITAIIHPLTNAYNLHVAATSFNYDHKKNMSIFKNNVNFWLDTIHLVGQQASYETTNDVLTINHAFTLSDDASVTSANSGIIHLSASTFTAKQPTTIYHSNHPKTESTIMNAIMNEPTTLTSDEIIIDFSNAGTPIITYQTNALIQQSGKSLTAESVILNTKSKHYVANKNVILSFDRLTWASNQSFNSTLAQKILSSPVTIMANRASFQPSSNQFICVGNVTVKQTLHTISSHSLIYNATTNQLIFQGNVRLKKLGIEQLSGHTLIIDIQNESFMLNASNKLTEINLAI